MKKTFVKGALVLGVAGIIIKLLGAFFRIPLANIIGDTGMGYYQTAYPVYVLLLTLTTSGIPTAIARMVSERTAEGAHEEAFRVFRLSFVLLMTVGTLSAAVLFFGADMIVGFFGAGKAALAMKAITPALLVVPAMAAFRGYFQGLQNMTPTAVSQIVEQLFRVISGLALSIFFVRFGVEYAAAGASFGAAAGGAAGLVVILAIYMKHRSAIRHDRSVSVRSSRDESAGRILWTLVSISIPITIGAAILPIMSNIDLAIVMNRLVDTGFSKAEANALYGQLAGFAAPVINFPQVLTQSLAVSLVPAVAAAVKTGDRPFLKYNVELSMRVAMIIGLPCALGIFALSKPIMLMLYPSQPESAVNAASCLAILGIGIIFLSGVQTLTGVLQGAGKHMVPVGNLAVGAVAKLVFTYFLTGVPWINVRGAALGTVAAYIIAMTLNMRAARKYTGAEFDISMTWIRPGAAALIMTGVVWLVYHGVNLVLGNAVSTILAVLAGGAVYAVLILLFKAVTLDELERVRGGKRITRIVAKFTKSRK